MGETASGVVLPNRRELADFHGERPLRWQDYADLWLRFPLGRVLDYGCGNGAFLERVGPRSTECWGVDIDPEKVKVAQRRGGMHAERVSADGVLPFPAEWFDTVILMEVIEHVADERGVLREATRVLRNGGRLLLTTPHAGLLTFLDPGNLKFLAPRIHRFIHCRLLRQTSYYEDRFGDARRREQGMIADFSTDQTPWHRHYRYRQIRDLAPPQLAALQWGVYFPGFRALWCARLALGVLTRGWVRGLPWPLEAIDRHLSRISSTLGDQLVVLFEKRA